MNKRLRLLAALVAFAAMASQTPAAASPADPDSLHVRGGWYAGVEVGVPPGFGTFTGFGHDKARAGYNAGVYGGYRFTPVLSAELSLRWGKTSMSASNCCVNSGYWLGADGVRYFAPVINMEGWDYADLKSDISLQQYGVRLNVNILGFFERTKTGRWTLDVSPALYAVGTKATFRTIAGNDKVMEQGTRWHLGYGGRLQAGYGITRNLSIGIYSEITALTGKSMDGIPEYKHGRNFVWESGVRVGWTFGKKRGKVKGGEPAVLPLIPGREVCTEEPETPTETVETVETTGAAAVEPERKETAVTPITSAAQEETAPEVIFPEVYFAFNSHAISKSEEAKLQTILGLLNEHPDVKVTLNGWCDTRGSVAVNKRISLQRAEAVKTWLVSRGIDAARITTVGNGSDRTATDASKARRVSTEQAGSVKVEINNGK